MRAKQAWVDKVHEGKEFLHRVSYDRVVLAQSNQPTCKSFCTGVPVKATRRRTGSDIKTLVVLELGFLRRCLAIGVRLSIVAKASATALTLHRTPRDQF